MTFTENSIEFESSGLTLRGSLYVPDGSRKYPAIVLTHGFGLVRSMFDDHNYPAVLASAGFVVLVYDNPNIGESDGEPRQELDPIAQQRGYVDAITLLCCNDRVDANRIGIWGSSFSGGHVLAVAAADRRVACVVSQVMTISGFRNFRGRNNPGQMASLRLAWAEDRIGRAKGEAPKMVGAGSEATTKFLSTLTPKQRGAHVPEVTSRTNEWYSQYDPGAFIERISPTPLLMIVATDDLTTPADDCLDAFNRALEPKQLLLIGGSHHDAYRRNFVKTSSAAVDFFTKHLRSPDSVSAE
jgi:fermentation-respiration switch protein FrsA (DUF1100 family)